MLKKYVSAVIIMVLLSNNCILSAANDKMRPADTGRSRGTDVHEHGQQFDIIKLTKDLNISAEQKEKLSAEKKRHNATMKTLQDSLHAKRSELTLELDKVVSDKARLDSISAEMKNIIAGMVDERLSSILRIKEILTPEQYKQFVEKKNKFPAKQAR